MSHTILNSYHRAEKILVDMETCKKNPIHPNRKELNLCKLRLFLHLVFTQVKVKLKVKLIIAGVYLVFAGLSIASLKSPNFHHILEAI